MERVLLLNATYEPLALVSDRRAVVLVLGGRAEVGRGPRHDCRVFHSAQPQIDVPAIVRLSQMVRIPRWARTPPLTRRAVLRRDGGLCAYCSQPADTVDHVIPRSRGGTPRVVQRGGGVQAGQPRQRRTSCSPSSAGRFGSSRPRPTATCGGCATWPRWTRSGSPTWPRPPEACRPALRSSTSSRFRAEPDRVAVVREVGAADPGARQHTTRAVVVAAAMAVAPAGSLLPDAVAGEGRSISSRGPALGGRLDPPLDPLWDPDVAAAAAWVGAWWVGALSPDGRGRGLEVHTGRAVPGALGGLVCFAGRGPGEVFAEGRKVVGLSQWRAREGALFSSCAYLRWDPGPLLAALEIDDAARSDLAPTAWRGSPSGSPSSTSRRGSRNRAPPPPRLVHRAGPAAGASRDSRIVSPAPAPHVSTPGSALAGPPVGTCTTRTCPARRSFLRTWSPGVRPRP